MRFVSSTVISSRFIASPPFAPRLCASARRFACENQNSLKGPTHIKHVALVTSFLGGDALARRLPRGYATLQDQLRRALLSAYLGIAEASSRQGADRLCCFRCARREACEAATALEGVLVLNLAPEDEILALLALLDRLCAMLTRLGRMGDSSVISVPSGQRGRER